MRFKTQVRTSCTIDLDYELEAESLGAVERLAAMTAIHDLWGETALPEGCKVQVIHVEQIDLPEANVPSYTPRNTRTADVVTAEEVVDTPPPTEGQYTPRSSRQDPEGVELFDMESSPPAVVPEPQEPTYTPRNPPAETESRAVQQIANDQSIELTPLVVMGRGALLKDDPDYVPLGNRQQKALRQKPEFLDVDGCDDCDGGCPVDDRCYDDPDNGWELQPEDLDDDDDLPNNGVIAEYTELPNGYTPRRQYKIPVPQ